VLAFGDEWADDPGQEPPLNPDNSAVAPLAHGGAYEVVLGSNILSDTDHAGPLAATLASLLNPTNAPLSSSSSSPLTLDRDGHLLELPPPPFALVTSEEPTRERAFTDPLAARGLRFTRIRTEKVRDVLLTCAMCYDAV
jgi:hypothetical protein